MSEKMSAMNGMTESEALAWRSLKDLATKDLALAKKGAAWWIKRATSAIARQRRLNWCRSIRGLHS